MGFWGKRQGCMRIQKKDTYLEWDKASLGKGKALELKFEGQVRWINYTKGQVCQELHSV